MGFEGDPMGLEPLRAPEHGLGMSEELRIALSAAVAGANVIRDWVGRPTGIIEKGVGDLVSEVDKRAEGAVLEVLAGSSARSNTLERMVPKFVLPRKFDPDSTIESIMKDLEAAISTGKSLGVRLLLANVAQQCYLEAAGLGHGQKDVSAVILPMEEVAGVKVGPA